MILESIITIVECFYKIEHMFMNESSYASVSTLNSQFINQNFAMFIFVILTVHIKYC